MSNVLTPAETIIWSADVPDEAALMAVLDTLPELRRIKIDRLFLTGIELDVLDRLAARGLQVFVDAKIYEIPSKAEAIARKYLVHKPWMLNCMAGIVSNGVMTLPEGSEDRDLLDGLKRFADACHEVGTRPCGVTVLTSKTSQVCQDEFGARPQRKVFEYMETLLYAGFTDAVCSPEEVRAIRRHAKFDGIDLHTPGVRLAGGDTQDQARVATPATVLADGGTTMVVGRPLTNGVPSKNWRVWMDVINAAQAA